jgi:hypothetical protein
MQDLLNLIRWTLLGLFRSKSSLEAEILALRHQLNVLRRTSPRRPLFSNFDRMIFVCLYRIAPRILDVLTIVEPETVIRWHRAGFRSFWRWRSRRRAGRPSVTPEIRRLIREMSLRSGALPEFMESSSSSALMSARRQSPSIWRGEGDLRRKAGGRSWSGTARLEEAVAAYRAALEERTRERVPLQWAATEQNLAGALQLLNERRRSRAGEHLGTR